VARKVPWWLARCGAILLLWAPLAAHHVVSAKFDSAKRVSLRGPVTAIDWANPHAHVFIAQGEAELESAGRLGEGDAARLTGAGDPTLTAGPGGAEVLIWETA